MFWNVKFNPLTLSLYILALLSLAGLYTLVFYQFFSIERLQGEDLTDKPSLVSLKRLQKDWITQPFVEIEISRGNHCRKGWEKLFSWTW